MQEQLHEDLDTLLAFFLEQVANPPDTFAYSSGLIASPSFFSVKALQTLVSNPLLSPAWIFLKNGRQPVSLEEHYLYKLVQSKNLAFMDKQIINQELSKGAALVLEGIDILDPDINAFSARLDDALPCSLTNCVAFFSQSGSEAYEGHVDADDVLVVQISGEKLWHIFARQQRRYAGTDRLTREQLGPEVKELRMRAGDALYVRAGVPHLCHTPGDHSLHLAFDLIDSTPNPKQITDEANRIYEYASEDPYVPAAKVMDKYIELLKSPEFQNSLKVGTQNVKEGAKNFRRSIGRASQVTALSKYL
ncbi:MAG: hypothetical protein AMS22_02940 [Thiotrichales bacterium SG8_50]|nr:MAG: hypothetical protein AMS22_02940 [Thiotrichales bacterium SG8_50]